MTPKQQGAEELKNLGVIPFIMLIFHKKQTDLSSIQDNLARNYEALTDKRHDSGNRRVLICTINTPL